MSGAEPPDAPQWEEARRWFAKAAEDLMAARVLAKEDVLDPAAFHVQQALEKILKGLLVAAAQDLRKTHDLETLAVLANAHWPALIPSPSPLAYISRWYLTSRYPGLGGSADPRRNRGSAGYGRSAAGRSAIPGACVPPGQCRAEWRFLIR
jgi:HEPN domain-containing protein